MKLRWGSPLVLVGLALALVTGLGASGPVQASNPDKDSKWSSQFTKKNGWSVLYGKKTGAWIATNDAGYLAIPKKRSSKKVSLAVVPVNRESRELIQTYVVDFRGFDRSGPVDVVFFEPSKSIPVQAFENVIAGQVVDIAVDLGDGTPCSMFFVIVQDRQGNWAIAEAAALHAGGAATGGP